MPAVTWATNGSAPDSGGCRGSGKSVSSAKYRCTSWLRKKCNSTCLSNDLTSAALDNSEGMTTRVLYSAGMLSSKSILGKTRGGMVSVMIQLIRLTDTVSG